MFDWGYTGDIGPERWDCLSDDYRLCGCGRAQSPIDIVDPRPDPALGPLVFDYRPSPIVVQHTGRAIQVDYAPGSRLGVEGREYELVQFHFHLPGEHRIGGQSYELELHLVHADADGALAVVGVVYEPGPADPFLAELVDHLPSVAGQQDTGRSLNILDALPADRTYYTYPGSLTMPPCSEGVRWLLLATPRRASSLQLKRFLRATGHNARPCQPLNDRSVRQWRSG